MNRRAFVGLSGAAVMLPVAGVSACFRFGYSGTNVIYGLGVVDADYPDMLDRVNYLNRHWAMLMQTLYEDHPGKMLVYRQHPTISPDGEGRTKIVARLAFVDRPPVNA